MARRQAEGADTAVAALAGAGVVAIVAGLIGLATIGYWYAADVGWTGSGSTIVEPRGPIVAAALVAGAAVLVGLVTVLVRRDVPARSLRGALLAGVTLLLAGSVWLAVDAYPQVRQAELVGIAEDGTVSWQIGLPVTEVFGIRSETADLVVLEGRADRRECDSEGRSVTIDRSTGEILAVEVRPAAYADASDAPAPPVPIAPQRGGFDVEQGSAPFICRN